ncbi:MAG: urease accessory protein UreF [Pseudomonadota bacterium]
MTDANALYRLSAWLSPSYPVGAYSYSHGLEWAVETGAITDRATLTAWVSDALEHGGGATDAVLLAAAWRATTAGEGVEAVAELAEAFQPSRERHLESTAQGRAFADVTRAAWGLDVAPAPYPVVVGQAAALASVALEPVILLYLHAFAANLVSAGVRLVPLGQTDGQRATAQLMPLTERVAAQAIATPLDALGSAAFALDIAAMRHETQYTRLFRS